MPDQALLATMIRTRLLGVRPEDQDLTLEDHDWRLILEALEASGRERQAARAESVVGEVIDQERCTVHGPIARYSEKCGLCEEARQLTSPA